MSGTRRYFRGASLIVLVVYVPVEYTGAAYTYRRHIQRVVSWFIFEFLRFVCDLIGSIFVSVGLLNKVFNDTRVPLLYYG